MPAIIPMALGASQIGLSLWAAKYSFAAITRLQQYEDASKTAAKISSTAGHELHKTRSTQTSGVLMIAATFIWSCVTVLQGVESSSPISLVLSSAITAGLAAARTHLSNFWAPKSGVPLVQTYNEGIENSKQIANVLYYMTIVSGLQAIYFAYEFIAKFA